MSQTKKTKLFIFLAIAIIALLLIISIAQIVSINNKQREIDSQRLEIDRLNSELNYYENQKSDNIDDPTYDDKNGDVEITRRKINNDNHDYGQAV